MIELVDTHCHIQNIGQNNHANHTTKKWLDAGITDVDKIINVAKNKNVTRLIVVGCDYYESKNAINLVKNRTNLYASIGIHPHEAKEYFNNQELLDKLSSLANQEKVVAIGECGLDYHYNHSPKDAQLAILEFQLGLASKHNLPVIFHVREAYEDFWPLLDKYPNIRGVLHSFTDNQANLDIALKRNLYIGVNGIVTFTNEPEQLNLFKNIPLIHLLLETDSPYLTPDPYRGNINTPEMVRRVAEFLAEIRHLNYENLASITTNNSKQLFGIN